MAAKKSAAKAAAKAEPADTGRTAVVQVEGEVVDAGVADARPTDVADLEESDGPESATQDVRESAKAQRIDPGKRFEDIERDRPGPGEIGYSPNRPPGAVRGRREPTDIAGYNVSAVAPVKEEDTELVTLVATRLGWDNTNRRKPGEVFQMRVKKGAPLPSWAARPKAKAADLAAVGRMASQYEDDPVHDENVEIEPVKAAPRKRVL